MTVDLLDGSGNVVATATTGAGGAYSFTTVGGTYTVRSARPSADADGSTTSTPVTIVGGGAPQKRDFAFTTPEPPTAVTTSAMGRVIDTAGRPVANASVTATPDGSDAGGPVSVTTGVDGRYTLEGLNPSTEYTVSVAGSDVTVDFTSGADETDVTTVPDLVIDAAAVTPTPRPSASSPVTTPVSSNGGSTAGTALAYTGADLTPGLVAAAAARAPRRRSADVPLRTQPSSYPHLQD
ncbi:carboxypeptidase-like regulatory domain-containing protein [Curtobacterium flaccumfaciens]|nr:carboxypeptidase-like regulatory domain-containing protein [Curtobacterium flaccumfaciens]